MNFSNHFNSNHVNTKISILLLLDEAIVGVQLHWYPSRYPNGVKHHRLTSIVFNSGFHTFHKSFTMHNFWNHLSWQGTVMPTCAYPGLPGDLLYEFPCLLSLFILVMSSSPYEPILLKSLMIYDSTHALCCFTCCIVLLPHMLSSKITNILPYSNMGISGTCYRYPNLLPSISCLHLPLKAKTTWYTELRENPILPWQLKHKDLPVSTILLIAWRDCLLDQKLGHPIIICQMDISVLPFKYITWTTELLCLANNFLQSSLMFWHCPLIQFKFQSKYSDSFIQNQLFCQSFSFLIYLLNTFYSACSTQLPFPLISPTNTTINKFHPISQTLISMLSLFSTPLCHSFLSPTLKSSLQKSLTAHLVHL